MKVECREMLRMRLWFGSRSWSRVFGSSWLPGSVAFFLDSNVKWRVGWEGERVDIGSGWLFLGVIASGMVLVVEIGTKVEEGPSV